MNPYKLSRPAVVSFSGGRTSGMMLYKILTAFKGTMPDDVVVVFNNTGLEHPKTYEFVEECGRRWGVRVRWLEYCLDGDGGHSFKEVTPDTANKSGEPFEVLIEKKQYLPNPVTRICTVNLKMRTTDRFLKSLGGFDDGYDNALGLRYDEQRRVARMRADNSRETIVCPLHDDKKTEEDVLAFWEEQPFDLDLPLGTNLFGNCVGCYLKSVSRLETVAEMEPEHLDWWMKMEERAIGKTEPGRRFRNDRVPYKALVDRVKRQGRLFGLSDDTIPCYCTD